MIERKDLLKLFKKYGFDSSLKEPFLYENKDQIGIYYTFKDNLYGQLSRIFIPTNIEAAESFLQNYYAYQNSHCKLIKLNNYKDPYAIPYFIEDIELLNENFLVNSSKDPLYRSANLLIKIIKEKMDLSLLTYENVKKLTDKYTRTKQELYNKKNIPFEDISYYNPIVIQNIKIKQENIVNDLNMNLKKCRSKEDIKKVIDDLIIYLKSLELEDSLINNKYFMLKIPIEIEQLKEEIKLYDEYEAYKKKKKKKLEFEEKLKKLEEKHLKNKVVSLASFVKNEQQRIKEKYDMINDIDYSSIADYLIEFDNLDIKESVNIEEKQGLKILKDEFDKLDENDKNILYLVTYFSNILTNYNHYIITEYYKNILSPINVLAKIKLFKDIDFTSLNEFEQSIKKNINKVYLLAKSELPCDITCYFKGDIKITNNILITSSKKSCMPKIDSNNPCIYIVSLKKGTLINFVPFKLTIDITNDDKIVLKENNPLFIMDCQKNKIIEDNSDIIEVSKIKILEKKTTDIITVSKIKIYETTKYKKIRIERKD